jgi:hypothetical protein
VVIGAETVGEVPLDEVGETDGLEEDGAEGLAA